MTRESTVRQPYSLLQSDLFAFRFRGTKAASVFCLIAALLLALFIPAAIAQSSATIPIFQFAAFYNLDMDFSPGQPMTINGKVRVNGNLWMYPQSTVTFNDRVEATLLVINQDDPNDQQNLTSYIPPAYNGGPPLSGVGRLDMLFGTTNAEAILNLPPPGLGVPNDIAYAPSNQTYLYNECDLIISNSTSGVYGKSWYGTNLNVYFSDYYYPGRLTLLTNDLVITRDGTANYAATNILFAGYSFLTNTCFYDFRESSTVQVVQIDIAKLNSWLTNNVTRGGVQVAGYPWNALCGGVDGAHGDKGHPIDSIYVYNTVPLTDTQLPAVRVIHGAQLPSARGLTIATAQPIYVLGNYNVQTNPAGPYSVNTTNTAFSYPAALMGDAISVLSGNWNDANSLSKSGSGYNNPAAGAGNRVVTSNITINAACFVGIVPSTFTTQKQYSGGLESFLRLNEDWSASSRSLWYNGSIVVMFPSIYATNFWIGPFDYSGYPTHNYRVPTRPWSFDRSFLSTNRLPPLTPLLVVNLPVVTTQPTGWTNVAGTTANFNVIADGTAPLNYQWQFNGTNLDGATNTMLTLTNLTVDQAGTYLAAVTNDFGSVTSSNAVLSVYATAAATLGAYSFSADSGFQFQVAGVPGFNYAVQASTNLVDWEWLVTNSPPFDFVDTDTTNFPQRFYRAIYLP